VLIGELYCCQTPHCRSEIRLMKASIKAAVNPRCSCGAEMKKPYIKPVVRQLDDSNSEFFDNFETLRKRQN